MGLLEEMLKESGVTTPTFSGVEEPTVSPELPMRQPANLFDMASQPIAPPVKSPQLERREAINEFTSDLLFTMAQSFAAGPQRGAGLAAALAGPSQRRTLVAEAERKSLLDSLAIEEQQLKIKQLQRDLVLSKQTIDYIEKPINGRMVKQAVDRHTGEVLWSSDLGEVAKPNIDPLSPEGIAAAVEKETKLAGVKPEKPQYNESWWIDTAIKMRESENGKPLSDSERSRVAGKARTEWADLAREKNPEIDSLNMRLRELQVQIAEQRANAVQSGGLTDEQRTQVMRLGNKFDSNPITKKYNVTAEGLQFIKGMDPNTKNPADHIALVYAFAKAMDPDSVVREGEYATVKKYAQSWLDQLGFDALRVVDNQGMLTADAMRNMQATMTAKAQPVLRQYGNLKKETARLINTVTGKGNGESYLIDYGAAFTEGGESPAPSTFSTPDGRKWRREGNSIIEVK